MLAGAVAVVAALILSGCSVVSRPPANHLRSHSRQTPRTCNRLMSTWSQVLPSVVQITTSHDLGSGIVFDTQGDIVTNAHAEVHPALPSNETGEKPSSSLSPGRIRTLTTTFLPE